MGYSGVAMRRWSGISRASRCVGDLRCSFSSLLPMLGSKATLIHFLSFSRSRLQSRIPKLLSRCGLATPGPYWEQRWGGRASFKDCASFESVCLCTGASVSDLRISSRPHTGSALPLCGRGARADCMYVTLRQAAGTARVDLLDKLTHRGLWL